MLEDLFVDLKSFLYSLAIISFAIVGLLVLPKRVSSWLGKFPVLLVFLFAIIMFIVIKVFN
ncbi:MAG: hypothetical protein CMD68_01095 [Gammaproteobacteria bacterium]|nr:hypothetical protein [Gammaproteobacteria bacterium]|tara:strand:+ start:224 stop:406 length:183 start_codon:yes stop_codon:yes gene_type:complete